MLVKKLFHKADVCAMVSVASIWFNFSWSLSHSHRSAYRSRGKLIRGEASAVSAFYTWGKNNKPQKLPFKQALGLAIIELDWTF